MARELSAGQRVGEYILEEAIGEGGFGQVWSARHAELPGHRVALKMPREPAFVTALRREGLIQFQLDHPAIVAVIGQDLSGEPPYIAMELIEGPSLRQILDQSAGPLSLARAAHLIDGVAHGLRAAHASGVAHGDLKPENVLVTADDAVKLGDFGLGRVILDELQHSVTTRSQPGIAGTLRNMAPELFEAGARPDAVSDLYSFAVLVFETLVGRPPQGLESIADHRADAAAYDALFKACYAPRPRRCRSIDAAISILAGAPPILEAAEPKSTDEPEVIAPSAPDRARQDLITRILGTGARDLEAIEEGHRALMALDPLLHRRLICWLAKDRPGSPHISAGLALLSVSPDPAARAFVAAMIAELPIKTVADTVNFIHGWRIDRRHTMRERKRFSDDMTVAYEASAKGVQSRLREGGGEFSGGEVLVTLGQYDKVQQVLDYLEIPYKTMPCKALTGLALRADQTLIVNCAGKFSAEGIENIRGFVTAGGTLITTDWALKTTLQEAFPGTIEWNRVSTRDDVVPVSWVDPDSAYTRGVEVEGQTIRWWLEGSSYPIKVKNRRVKVLVRSQEMKKKYKNDALVVQFAYGEGMVFHLTSHYYLQRSQGNKAQKSGEVKISDEQLAAATSSLRLLGNILYERRRAYGV